MASHNPSTATLILLPTKLNRPPLTGDFVLRPRLLKKLNAGLSRKLILISAPAGFGKSTLAVSWLESLPARADSPVHSAWFSCDEGDSSLAQFLRYVVAAARIVFPNAFERLAALLEAPALPPVAYLANVMLGEIAALPEEFYLVLDDFHLVDDPDAHRLVAALLAGMPTRAHLVIVTRRDPPLPLARLRVQQQLTELRAADLRFDEVETAAFVSNALGHPLPSAAVARLEDQTEGWIAALRLATLSMLESPDPEQVVDALAAARRPAMEFLAEQVLSQQDDEMRDFLLRSAILDRMGGDLCDAVLCLDEGKSASCGRDWLERLERSNMFLIPLDRERTWYRYHRLFRDLLLARLTETADASEVAELHRRAAEWFTGRGLTEEAIRHYLAAGDLERAGLTAEQVVFDLLNNERLAAAKQLLDMLPESVSEMRPGLLLAHGWSLIFQWRFRPLQSLLARVERTLPPTGDDEDAAAERWRGQHRALAAFVAYFALDDPEQSLAHALAAVARIARSDAHAYATAVLVLAFALNRLGRRGEALARLRDELALARAGDLAVESRHQIAISAIHLHAADLERLGDGATALLELAQARGRYTSVAFGHYFLGCKHLLQGDPTTAAEHFGYVSDLRYIANAKIFQDSLHGLALARQAVGDAEGAQEAAQQALALALDSMPGHVTESRSILTRIALLRGENPARLPLSEPPPALTWNAYIEMPALTHVRLLIARGSPTDLAAAEEYLAEAQRASRVAHDDRRLVEGLVLEAVLFSRLDRVQDAHTRAQEALALAEPGGLTQPFIEAGADFATLLAGLPEGSAQAFRSTLLARMRAGANPKRRRSTISRQGADLLESLTNREEEVLRLLVERLSDKEIAEALTISPLTAHKHVTNILGKLQVGNRRQAALKARALGLLD